MHQVQHKPNTSTGPRGELASRMLAMPSHTNPMGNIFGGWIMSVMDAALMTATKIAYRRKTVEKLNACIPPPIS
jgi:acyl-CoA hydrolase